MGQYLADLEILKVRKKMRISLPNNKFLVLVYLEDGVYAIQDKCPHMGASLFTGRLEEDVLFCKEHNLGISVKTGVVVNENQADFLHLDSYNRSVRIYQLTISEGKIYLEK